MSAKTRQNSPWRDVLIVTGGATPPVVTETLYALGTRIPDRVVPSKIICAVTMGVANGFGTAFEGAFERLQAEIEVKADWRRRLQDWRAGSAGLFIAFPCYADGRPVEDIRSDEDAVRFGDFVSEIVRFETSDKDARIHLSLAGGRKTMSFHGGAAMSLFGRTQDELSHVLVHPQEFEGCENFWFPTKTSWPVKHKNGRTLNANDPRLKIELANIPYLRVRDRIPRRLITHAMDYKGYVAQTNAALGRVPLFLELTTAEQRVRVGDILDFDLPNTEFALYQLMAEWKQHDRAGAGPTGVGNGHRGWLTARMFEYPDEYSPNPIERFIKIYDDTFKTSPKRPENLPLTSRPRVETQRKTNSKCFGQWKSRLIHKLHERLHLPDLADRFGAPLSDMEIRQRKLFDGKAKTVRIVVFGLRLLPVEIIIHAG